MRIGIVSDTHGLLRREVIEGLQGVDHIIHAGDIDKKEVLDELEKIAPVTAVRGNADKDWAVYVPEKALLEFEGNKIYVIHNKGKNDFSLEKKVIKSTGSTGSLPKNIDSIITKAMKLADKGSSHEEIAAKLKIPEELSEQICRMYFSSNVY